MPKFQSLRITKYTQPTIANKSKVTLPKLTLPIKIIKIMVRKRLSFSHGPLLGGLLIFKGCKQFLLVLAPHDSPKSPGESSRWSKVSRHPLAFQIFQDLEVVFFWGSKNMWTHGVSNGKCKDSKREDQGKP